MTHFEAACVLVAAAVPDLLGCGSSSLLYREHESVVTGNQGLENLTIDARSSSFVCFPFILFNSCFFILVAFLFSFL